MAKADTSPRACTSSESSPLLDNSTLRSSTSTRPSTVTQTFNSTSTCTDNSIDIPEHVGNDNDNDNHNGDNDNDNDNDDTEAACQHEPTLHGRPNDDMKQGPGKCSVLVDIVGARWLPIEDMDTYCVIQYGSKTIHRTKPFAPTVSRATRISQALRINHLFGRTSVGTSANNMLQRTLQNPIWTIEENSLFSLPIMFNDIRNNKPLTITIWARPRPNKLKLREQVVSRKAKSKHTVFVGKVRISAAHILDLEQSSQRYQERQEYPLLDELGRTISSSSSDDEAMLALRYRVASTADVAFTDYWNHHPRPLKIFRLLQLAQLQLDWERPKANLVTEIPEHQVKGASVTSAMAAAFTPACKNPGHILIKPYPDPARPTETDCMTTASIKSCTRHHSTTWIQAGSKPGSLGRIYLEILSCHGLPNVDIGPNNATDAFCTAILGDVMVQTDVIDDELSPHWMPWTQRAFVMELHHPSNVLYLAVFGYKRSPLAHKPIGRVEINPINLQTKTLYNLEYELFQTSHEAHREPRGKIRIRLRMEYDNERKALLAALKPPPTVFVNVRQTKSWRVARYTACGEYDNGTKFKLKVLQSYVDEILEGFLRRVVYAVHDGFISLVLWRDQFQVTEDFGVPIYSILAFTLGMLAVEHPRLIPAILCFSVALFLIATMQQRVKAPSPWRRCLHWSHHLRVLVTGNSAPTSIRSNEGSDEQKALDEAHRLRVANDQEFFEKKEAIEREIEELETEDSKSKTIPLELMVVLGKVQAIVGDVCRLLRSIDAIITWEKSDLAFFLTSGLLVLGFLFIFIPWGFLFTWIGRICVVFLFGPQNKLFDVWWYQDRPTREQRIRKLFSRRMFQARCSHEESGKLRAFRHVLFGQYSTLIPSIMWTPHRDCPLPLSSSRIGHSKPPGPKLPLKMRIVTGQQLEGTMIPRASTARVRNDEESQRKQSEAEYKFSHDSSSPASAPVFVRERDHDRDYEAQVLTEGFEVTELYDEEAGYVRGILNPLPEESIRELGIEVLDSKTGSPRYQPARRSTYLNELLDESHKSSTDPIESPMLDLTQPIEHSSNAPTRIPRQDIEAFLGQSTMDLGIEVSEYPMDEPNTIWHGDIEKPVRNSSPGDLGETTDTSKQETQAFLRQSTVEAETDTAAVVSQERPANIEGRRTTEFAIPGDESAIDNISDDPASYAGSHSFSTTHDLSSSVEGYPAVKGDPHYNGIKHSEGFCNECSSAAWVHDRRMDESSDQLPPIPDAEGWNLATVREASQDFGFEVLEE